MKREPGFFEQVDRLVERFTAERDGTRQILKALGWTLRPLSSGNMWRARRWTKKHGTQRLFATTSHELVDLAQKEHAARPKRKTKKETKTESVAA